MKIQVVLLTLALVGGYAFAQDECPVKWDENYMDNVVKAVQAKDNCYEAGKVAEACAMGSSGDVQIAGSAQEICAKDYESKLTQTDRGMLNTLMRKCENKYANMQGTMYIGATAFCELQVAELFSELYTPAE